MMLGFHRFSLIYVLITCIRCYVTTVMVTSINVLPSKNQALCKYCTVIKRCKYLDYFTQLFNKSREKGLITKERICILKLFLIGPYISV